MPNIEDQNAPINRDTENDVASGGGDQADYGGMDQNLGNVDLAGASEVGSDPPGGLGTDLGGGNREIGEDETGTGPGDSNDVVE